MNKLEKMARDTAARFKIDPDIFVRLIQQESGWDPKIGSPAGAVGLAQLMPDTAKGLGVTDRTDPRQSLEGGARYLRQQLDKFGSYEKALAAYNAGPGAVQKYGGIPPFTETQNYVKTILGGQTVPVPDSAGAGTTTTTTTGGVDPVTLLGQGGDTSAELPAVMDFLKGKLDPIGFATAMQEVQEPATVTLPGVAGTTTTTTTPDDPSTTSSSGSGSSPSLPTGGLGELAKTGKSLMARLGFTNYTGQRTDANNAAVGGAADSDHLMRDGRVAFDFGMTGAENLRKAGTRLAARFGIPETSPGFWQGEITAGGKKYKVQVIAGSKGHYDHTHLGIRAL